MLAHIALIAGAVVATRPAPDVPEGSLANRVYYLPPPPPRPAHQRTPETVRYVALAPAGPDAGTGISAPGPAPRPAPAVQEPAFGDQGLDSTTTAADEESLGSDSVYTIVEVDSAAERMPESRAPAYPPKLLEDGVEGSVIVRFIVDTTGLPDVRSFRVVFASHREFAQAVRDALPGMRFTSARIGAAKVRQLVELPLSFKIQQPAADAMAANRKPPARPPARAP